MTSRDDPLRDDGPSTLAVRGPNKRCGAGFRASRVVLHDWGPSTTRVNVCKGSRQDR